MKTKIGDWVKNNVTKEVMRIVDVKVDARGTWVRTYPVFGDNGGALSEYFTKLPIKFKDIRIVIDGYKFWRMRRYQKDLGNTLFACSKSGAGYRVWVNPIDGNGADAVFPTIEEAKDWLELQYATMIAEARGLV